MSTETETTQAQNDYSRAQVYQQQVADADRSAKKNERDQLDGKVIQGSTAVVGQFAQATAVLGLNEGSQKQLQSVMVVTKLAFGTAGVVKDALKRLFKTEADIQPSTFAKTSDVENVSPGIRNVGSPDEDAKNDADIDADVDVAPEIKATGTGGPVGSTP